MLVLRQDCFAVKKILFRTTRGKEREGDFKDYHGLFSIGLLDGRLQFEGPIWKDRTSFNIGLRRSWIDVLAEPVCLLISLAIKSFLMTVIQRKKPYVTFIRKKQKNKQQRRLWHDFLRERYVLKANRKKGNLFHETIYNKQQ